MPNNRIPTPRSYSEVLGGKIDAFTSRFGIRSLKVGSPILSILEAGAQSDLRNSEDIFGLLAASSLDNASGLALARIGQDEQVPQIMDSPASGTVTISDTSFSKISSQVFQGSAAPIIGTTVLKVKDASEFPATGEVYIGRGTSNFEGPLSYTATTDFGTYWTITLATGTLRFHNVGESVVLAQGGSRSITAGTTVQTAQGNVSTSVQFKTLFAATIDDGETEVTNVRVVALRPGVLGNVSANSITEFSSDPFTGASVTNPTSFTNGRSMEDEESWRERIRAARQSRTKGTSLALKTYSVGVTSTDENKRVISANVVNREDEPTVLYIDDGTGYEETSTGVGYESFVDLAVGGEQYFKTSYKPVSKAYVLSTESAPFILADGMKLKFVVGGQETEHTFDADDFLSIGNATAYEVVASINANSALGWSARTAESGTKVAIFAKADTNEAIQWSEADDDDSNGIFQFPVRQVESLNLYLNDELLYKDGLPAQATSNTMDDWGLVGSQTLILAVDGTPAVTYTFTDDDFVDNATGYYTVANNSLAAWATVFNARLPGVTASVVAGAIILESNLGANSRAEITISGGSLVTNGMFDTVSSTGRSSDYTLNRNRGDIKLTTALSAGDSLTAGSTNTRAFLRSDDIDPVNFVADANLWFAVDQEAEVISTPLTSSVEIDFTIGNVHRWGHTLRINSADADLWDDAEIGDWIVFWDPSKDELVGTHRIARVGASGAEIERKDMAYQRYGHTATKLDDGRILVVGGWTSPEEQDPTVSCEIYDPDTQLWSSAGSLSVARAFHRACLLNDGRVLVVGGKTGDTAATDSTELYDPDTDTWSVSDPYPAGGVFGHSLATGGGSAQTRCAVTGGYIYDPGLTAIDECWYFDPADDTWKTLTALSTARAWHASGITTGGRILVVGGENESGTVLDTCERWLAGAWSAASGGFLGVQRQGASLVMLTAGAGSGELMLFGGSDTDTGSYPTLTATTYYYNEGGDAWVARDALNNGRYWHGVASNTTDDTITVVGGHSGAPWTTSNFTETYDMAANTWTEVAAPTSINATSQSRFGATLTLIDGTDYIMVGGASDLTLKNPWASAEIYFEGDDVWAAPDVAIADPLTNDSVTLPNAGMVLVRSNGLLQKVTIPSGNNYTAPVLVDNLNGEATSARPGLIGATANVYRTKRINLRTNTFKDVAADATDEVETGDIALVAADVDGQKAEIEVETKTNAQGHMASVESGNSQYGTPNFNEVVVRGSTDTDAPVISWAGESAYPAGCSLVMSRSLYDRAATAASRYGTTAGFQSAMSDLDATVDGFYAATLRNDPGSDWIPGDRGYLASGYAFTPDDSLTVLVDGDVDSKRYTVGVARKVTPTTSTYGIQNYFTDADNDGESLTAAFGVNDANGIGGFRFDDFAVFMAARGVTDVGPGDREVLWRWHRLGPDGNNARIRYILPSEPNEAVSVQLDNETDDQYNNVSVVLASGDERTGYNISDDDRVGTIALSETDGLTTVAYIFGFKVTSATRVDASDETTLTLDFPSGMTALGLTSGVDTIHFEVSGTGLFTSQDITSWTTPAPNQIRFTDTTVGDATVANPGALYPGAGQVSNLTGGSVAQGDFIRVASNGAMESNFTDVTVRITTNPTTNPYWVSGVISNFGGSVSGTPDWTVLGNAEDLTIFENVANTTTDTIAVVDSLIDDDSVVPVAPTVLGTGDGILDRSSDERAGEADSWTYLTDGINYVSATTIPTILANNYQFTFKNAINADLVNADWDNEDIYLVPVTGKNVVDWLNIPAISGLFSVAGVELSSRATKVQIASDTVGSGGSVQVQGGSANSTTGTVVGSAIDTGDYMIVTVPTADAAGMVAGAWCSIDNATVLPKDIVPSSLTLESIDADGNFVFDGGDDLYDELESVAAAIVAVEQQGKFVCYKDTKFGADLDLSNVYEGCWVRITAPASGTSVADIADANTGIYRVVRVIEEADTEANGGAMFWIENDSSVPEALVECDLFFYSPESVMPGDTLNVSTAFWGTGNQGTWTIETVGDDWTNPATFKVNTSDATPEVVSTSPGALDDLSPLVSILEGEAHRSIKQIHAISPNQDDADYVDVKFNSSYDAGKVSAGAGSIVTMLDKLNFPLDIVNGADGYRYTTGLIGEVNKVIYGDPANPAEYPGVVAADNKVNIQGPLVRRIEISLSIRVRNGSLASEIANQVKSAVALVVNSTGIGESIAISDIVAAAARVRGVMAVTVIYPDFAVGSDLIEVQPFEKPMILNVDTDVTISFVGQ